MERTPPIYDSARYVIVRFCLKIGVFGAVAGIQVASGHQCTFATLAGLSAILCVLLAVHNGELPSVKRLNYWDEAGALGGLAHFLS